MATISQNDLAPAEKVTYAFNGVEFELEGEGTYETTDNELIANARAHPWLTVEVPGADQLGGVYIGEHLAPEDDVLSGVNSKVNDPEAVLAELERRRSEEAPNPLAVNAALRQTEVEFAGRVAETLAAHDAVEETADQEETQVVAEPSPNTDTPVEPPVEESPRDRRVRELREQHQATPNDEGSQE